MANANDIYFPRTEKKICWKDRGHEYWKGLAIPDDWAKQWDGVPGDVNFCIFDLFDEDRPMSYVKVEITGRKLTNVLGRGSYGAKQGMRAKLTFAYFDSDIGEHVYDPDSVTAWVVD